MSRGAVVANGQIRPVIDAPAGTASRTSFELPSDSSMRGDDRNSALLVELFRTTDAAVAVFVLVAVLVATNVFHGFPEGLEAFLRLRLTVKNILILTCLAILWPAIFSMFGLYLPERLRTRREEALSVVAGCSVGTVLVLAVPLVSVSGAFQPSALVYFWAGTIVMTLGSRYAIRRASAIPSSRSVRNVLIVGSGPRAYRVYSDLLRSPGEYNVVGFVDSNQEILFKEIEQRLLGGSDELEQILVHNVVDEVLIALPIRSRYAQVQEAIGVCERVGVESKYLADVFEYSLARPRYEGARSMPAVALKVVTDDHRLLVKRLLDIVGSMVGLVLLAPLLVLIAIAIKVTGPGPVLFAQERYGLNKRRFTMYKFRTMVSNAEELQATLEALNEVSGPVFKIREDPRITTVGRILRRTSLDELPQLFNVLRGEMSLVGPRPLPTRDVSNFSEAWPMRRFSVRPGLTCLWQISGRSNLQYSDWMIRDLQYIDEWSLGLDLRILLKTLPVVVRGTGAV